MRACNLDCRASHLPLPTTPHGPTPSRPAGRSAERAGLARAPRLCCWCVSACRHRREQHAAQRTPEGARQAPFLLKCTFSLTRRCVGPVGARVPLAALPACTPHGTAHHPHHLLAPSPTPPALIHHCSHPPSMPHPTLCVCVCVCADVLPCWRLLFCQPRPSGDQGRADAGAGPAGAQQPGPAQDAARYGQQGPCLLHLCASIQQQVGGWVGGWCGTA